MKTALELRELVIENMFEMNRLSADVLGKEDYNALFALYDNALTAITAWAQKNENHTATEEDKNAAFNAVKPILELYTAEDGKVIVDENSMFSIRDRSTKPVIKKTAEFKAADKLERKTKKDYLARLDDLVKLGAPVIEAGQTMGDYAAKVRELGIKTLNEKTGIDALSLCENACVNHANAEAEVARIKSAGKWHWRGVDPVELNVFADLIENYIAGCLTDGHNFKTWGQIKEERAARRAEARKSK